MTIGRTFDPRLPYPVQTMGGIFDDYIDAAVGVLSPVSAVAKWATSDSPTDPAFSDPDLYARSMQAYQVRNAIDTGVAAKATGAKVGPPKSTATKSTATTTTTVTKPTASEGMSYATIGGAAAVLGAGAAYATGHKQAALGLGVVGLGVLAYGFFGGSR